MQLTVSSNNLHGSSSGDLADAYLTARTAVLDLSRAVDQAQPNGRDYYPLGADAIKVAIQEHSQIAALATAVADELLYLADPAFDAGGKALSQVGAGPARPSRPPVLHLNGTSLSGLTDPARAVFRAAQAAEEAISKTIPNGRDYSTPETWTSAREEHVARVRAIKQVGQYFLLLAMAVKDQAKKP